MATTNYITKWILILILMTASLASSSNATTDLAGAIEEMRKASYFTFVVLVKLAPQELIQGNLTFLMPKDKTLSGNSTVLQSSIADFLLQHSIPSPLLFEYLQHFPTGSILPSSKPGLFLNITNGGSRRNFFLNNVRITSPNICTTGSSIRCHGIDGVVQPFQMPSHLPSLGAVVESPHSATASPAGLNMDPSIAPPPSNSSQPQKSGCRPQMMIKSCDFTLLKPLTCLMFLVIFLEVVHRM